MKGCYFLRSRPMYAWNRKAGPVNTLTPTAVFSPRAVWQFQEGLPHLTPFLSIFFPPLKKKVFKFFPPSFITPHFLALFTHFAYQQVVSLLHCVFTLSTQREVYFMFIHPTNAFCLLICLNVTRHPCSIKMICTNSIFSLMITEG